MAASPAALPVRGRRINLGRMVKKGKPARAAPELRPEPAARLGKPSSLLDNRVVNWGETKDKRAFEDRTPARRPTSTTCGPLRRTRPRAEKRPAASTTSAGHPYRFVRPLAWSCPFDGRDGKSSMRSALRSIPNALPCRLCRSTTAPNGKKTSSNRLTWLPQ